MKTMVRQVVFLKPMEGTPRRSRWMPEGGCDPVGSLRWSRLLPGPADPWRENPTPQQVYWQGL